MHEIIWQDIYNALKARWWGRLLIVLGMVLLVAFAIWNSLPDSVKERRLASWMQQSAGDSSHPPTEDDLTRKSIDPVRDGSISKDNEALLVPDLKHSPLQTSTPLPVTIPKSPTHSVFAIFKDCPLCPEMVPLPGSQFAIAAHETTFVEYDAFAEETGRPLPDDNGFGRANLPVINVSWYDAVAYAEWLTAISQRRYRLLTEDEWEYAARSGRSQDNPWSSNDEACVNANIYDKSIDFGDRYNWRHACSDGYSHTAPVGSFKSNDFGVSDLIGNVWEWTSSCWNHTDTLPCKERVVRGGSWKSGIRTRANDSYELSFSSRQSLPPNTAHNDIGFRIATTTP